MTHARCGVARMASLILAGWMCCGLPGCGTSQADDVVGRRVQPVDFLRPEGAPPPALASGASARGSATSAAAESQSGPVPEPLPPGLDVPPDDGGDQADAPRTGAEAAGAPSDDRSGRTRPSRTPPPPGSVDSRRDRWIVDSLVGQVNGRPIFADEFLEPMGDRLTQMVAELSRNDARIAIIREVSQRFDQWVDSELVIAEAESLLTPEEKQGLLAFLQDLRETEILQRGGTRTSAEESVQEQYGGATLQDVLDARKNRALAGNLLQKRVRPRTIVTWRDMERDFQRRVDEFAPGPTYVLGRIQLNTRVDAARIDTVKALFAQGKTFAEVTTELKIPEEGRWAQGAFTLGPEGLDGTDFRDEIKAQIKLLKVGDVSPPFQVGSSTMWLSLLSKDEPPPRSIYERDLQLALRSELEQQREAIERGRYVASLRRQWVTEGIEAMRTRLIDIALKRYWQ